MKIVGTSLVCGLVLAFVLWSGFLLVSIRPGAVAAKESNTTVERPDREIVELSKASRLEGATIGEGGPSKVFALYRALCANSAKISMKDLLWLKGNGTPAARVYASYLMNQKDPSAGTRAFLELLDDDTALEYQSGCEVLRSSVSDVGRQVVATGRFLDFDLVVVRAHPMYVSELSKAAVFANEVGSESGRHVEYLIYDAALKSARQLTTKDLDALMAGPSSAGRLYAALLQDASGKYPKSRGYDHLVKDNSKVLYQNGCKGMHSTVAEIAQALRDKGNFYGFKTSKAN